MIPRTLSIWHKLDCSSEPTALAAGLNDATFGSATPVGSAIGTGFETGASSAASVPVLSDNDSSRLHVTLIDNLDQERLSDLVRNHAARVMRLKPADIELTQPLSELGLDSLMATELRAQLGQNVWARTVSEHAADAAIRRGDCGVCSREIRRVKTQRASRVRLRASGS